MLLVSTQEKRLERGVDSQRGRCFDDCIKFGKKKTAVQEYYYVTIVTSFLTFTTSKKSYTPAFE
jgi:hypothetical protein